MIAKITIPEFYQESWQYLKKCKIRPQNILLESGLNGIYEKAREMKFNQRIINEDKAAWTY